MYMPKLARFTARDPLAQNGAVLFGGIPDVARFGSTLRRFSVHFYVYAENDPVNNVDPSGLVTIGARVLQPTLKLKFDAWYKLEKKDVGWWTKLPKCPCKIELGCDGGTPQSPDPDVWLTPKEKKDFPPGAYFLVEFVFKGFVFPPDLHPGAIWDMRQKNRTKGKKGDHGNQCNYDAEGRLITGGMGAGTADKRYYGQVDADKWDVLAIIAQTNQNSDRWRHLQHDVIPFWAAWILDGKKYGPNVKKYLEVRPTLVEAGCKANIVG